MGRGLPLRLDRQRCGVDQQRGTPGSPRGRAANSSTARRTQQVLGGAAKPTDQLVTVVVTHRVSAGRRRRIPGLAGSTRVGGEQVSRLSGNRAVPPDRGRAGQVDGDVPLRHRRRPRRAGSPPTNASSCSRRARSSTTSSLRTVDSSFGSWFAFDEHGHRHETAVGPQDVHRGVGRPVSRRWSCCPSPRSRSRCRCGWACWSAICSPASP